MKKLFLLLVANVMMVSVADAQLNNLVKKAKSAVKTATSAVKTASDTKNAATTTSEIKSNVTSAVKESKKPSAEALKNDPNASDTNVRENYTLSPAQLAAAYENLDAKLFPYQPYYTPEHIAFYQPDSLFTFESYGLFCYMLQPTENSSTSVGWISDFYPYDKDTLVPVVDITLNSYFATFLSDPNGVLPLLFYVRAGVMCEAFNSGKVKIVGDSDKYQQNDGVTDYTRYEIEKDRLNRWSTVYHQAQTICREQVPFNNLGTIAVNLINQYKRQETAGEDSQALRVIRELEFIMNEIENSKLNPHDDNVKALEREYEKYKGKHEELSKKFYLESQKAVDMPKACTVAANLQQTAAKLAKERFGDKFVKVIFTESNWHVFKNPSWPYNIRHRSMNIDIITKEGDVYMTNHWVLKQLYRNGNYADYGIMAQMVSPISQKVNYK